MSPKLPAKLCVLLISLFILALSAEAQTATHKTPFDFDGDNKTDLTVYRPAASTWYIFQSQSQTARSETFGVSKDLNVRSDYDGVDEQQTPLDDETKRGVQWLSQSPLNCFS